jgi:ABC-2 type transport system permease protein
MKWGITVMKSKTSLINRGILLNDFKRFAWIGIGYLLLLLFSTPLKIVMLYSQLKNDAVVAGVVLENGGVAAIDLVNATSRFLSILQFDTNAVLLQVMSLIVIPVLTGLLLFRYLQDSQASDMVHALPVKRETIYNTHVLAGIILLFLPLILTALATWALAVGLNLKEITGAVILTWLGVSLLMNLLFFIVTAAVGMVTGMSSVQGALSFILLLLPSGLSILLLYNVSQFVYGFPYSYYLEQVTSISPLIRLTEVSNYPVGSVEAGVYLACSVVIYFLGRYFYRKRPLESAGNAIVFDILRPIFTYSVAFCFMLLVGGNFYSSQNSMGWTYFGYFIGSILAYFLAEMLLNKSLQVFQMQRVKGYGVFCLAIVAIIGLLQIDFTGYEKRLPAPEEIKSIYFDNSFYALRAKDNMRTVVDPDDGREYTYQLFVPGIFTEAEAITDIHSLHRQIIANRLEDKKDLLAKRSNGSFQDLQQICLAYELEDGKHLYREYTILVPKYASSLKPIYESPEYKEVHNEILRIDAADANMLEISARVSNKNLRIVDRTLIQQAISALQRDINEETYEEMTITNRSPSWANINITLDNKWIISLDWEKSYEHFDQWLKDTGQYDQARLVPADIKYVLLDKFTGEIGESVIYEEKPGVLKLTEPERLEFCLRNYTHGYTRGNEQAAYHVVFELKDGSIIYGFLFEEDAPGFIKEHFAG